MTLLIEPQLLNAIRDVLHKSRSSLQQVVNHTMVETYWQVGRLIVEQEQQGKQRAVYGAKQLSQLSEKLQAEFGKGFDVSNLRNMRKFYQSFPIQDAVRPELTWTHYRRLIRLDNQAAEDWYLQESIEQNWSSRTLDRQINKLYYERLLSSQKSLAIKEPLANKKSIEKQTLSAIKQEANQNTHKLKTNARDFLRDPYVFDFLNLPVTSLLESTIE